MIPGATCRGGWFRRIIIKTTRKRAFTYFLPDLAADGPSGMWADSAPFENCIPAFEGFEP
jgi:hypothetical protein